MANSDQLGRDQITGEPNSPSLIDLFHHVNSLLPDNQEVVEIKPDMVVSEAIRLMMECGISQVPVVAGKEVLGVFSFRSLAIRMLEMESVEGVAIGNLTVDEFIQELEFVHIREEPWNIFSSLELDEAVFVGEPNRLQGIIRPMDAVRHYYRLSRPFFLLAEIEQSLRKLIRTCVDDDELRICIEQAMLQGGRRIPFKLEEMTFSQYIRIIENENNWGYFELAFGRGEWRRASTITRLDKVREIRNIAFHFKRELQKEDFDELASCHNWLFQRARIIESGRKGGSND